MKKREAKKTKMNKQFQPIKAIESADISSGSKWRNMENAKKAFEKAGYKTRSVSMHENIIMGVGDYNDDIQMNVSHTEYWKDPAGFMKERHENKVLSTDHPKHIIYHEIAHVEKRFKDRRIDFEEGEKEIAEKVSKYAAYTRNEFIAEYITGRRLGKTYPEDVNALYNKLNDLLKEKP